MSRIHPLPNATAFLQAAERLAESVARYRAEARRFYYAVLRARYRCPACGARMRFAACDCWSCDCGHTLDPSLVFALSPCCGVKLIRNHAHYACARCRGRVASPFLFDERLFDRVYFRERMRQTRERRRTKREEMRKRLAGTRSPPVVAGEGLHLHDVPGLAGDLDAFLGMASRQPEPAAPEDVFDLDCYKSHIRAALEGHERLFTAIPPLPPGGRRDRVRRFMTLLFLEHEGELRLVQYGERLLVEPNEAHIEG